MQFIPSYQKLLQEGILEVRVKQAKELLKSCRVCARHCGVNRLEGELGACKTGKGLPIASYGAHHGEEDTLRGSRGSGTIFFAHCNLKCQYCQNHDISQTDGWFESPSSYLAEIMLELQRAGCHNINLVSPSHIVPQVIEGIYIAAKMGLTLPIVYNSGGYDSMESLKMLDGIIDIYMPDMKYGSEANGKLYSKVRNYPSVNQKAVKEMHTQVGDLVRDEQGLAKRGLLVRHLVLPNGIAGSQEVFRFLAEEVSKDTYINIMDQYYPSYNSSEYPELSRRISPEEYEEAVAMAKRFGLWRFDRRQEDYY
ncbi:MAG: hypothetical protein R3302_02355 [Sulfurimonadaceae bacterium]|nr:hypothetical protein [Sulfurimonadaceae bacterium]